MGEVTVQACAEFIQLEIERLDSLGPDEKSNAEYFERNTLLYSWLLQRRWLAVRYSELSPLIGATELELGRVTSALRRFIEKSNTKAHRLHSAMELAVEQVFNDPSQHYRILEAVPYFTNVRGFEFLEYLNLLEEPSAMPFASLVMNAFRQALPSVQIAMPFDDLPHVRVVSGQGFSDEWHFILAVFPHYGMLSKDEVDALKGIIFDVRDDLQGKYGILETVVIAPGVNDSGRTSLKRNHHFHFLWGLSSLRFFHLFDTLVHKHRDYFPLVEAEFPVIFDANQPSTIFSIREALDRLDSAVENKKKKKRAKRRSGTSTREVSCLQNGEIYGIQDWLSHYHSA